MLNSDPLISVIIPAYNIDGYLPRCLDSVLKQTYSNLEVIVISDGSTDGTNDIIKMYAEKDKRVVPVFKENSGVSDTRNKGLDIANGDYIGFVDGDDYIESDMYEKLIKNALEYNADISHCGYQMVFPNHIDYYYNTRKKVLQNHEQGLFDIISGEYVEPGIWNKIYRSELIEDIRFEKNLREKEDLLFNVFAFNKSKISIYEDIVPYKYILRKGSASTGELKKYHVEGSLFVARKIYEIFKINEKLNSVVCRNWIVTNIRLYKGIILSKNKELKELFKAGLINNLKNSRNTCDSIEKKLKLERTLIIHFPYIYLIISKIYRKLYKSKYEIK